MSIEQAATTATNVILDGDMTVIVHRDRDDPTTISLIFMDDTTQEIVHEVNVQANSHGFLFAKDLKRLVEYK